MSVYVWLLLIAYCMQVTLDPENSTQLVIPSTATNFTVTGAGFDSGELQLNELTFVRSFACA